MSNLSKGLLIGLVGTAFWSSTAVFISRLTSYYGMQPLVLAVWRDSFVVAGMLPALLIIRPALVRIQWKNLPVFVLFGLVLAAFNAVWTLSVKANGASVSTVMAYGSAGFTALLGWWIFHERLGPPKITAVILSLGGIVLVANAYDPSIWRSNLLGITVGLLSGLLFAIYSLTGKAFALQGINPWTIMLYSFAFAAGFLVVFNLFPALPGVAGSPAGLVPNLPPLGWLLLVALAFGPTILGYGLYNVSLNYLPASIANLVATTEPAFTAVQSYLLLGERLTLVQILGGLSIIAAVFLARVAEERAASKASALAIEPVETLDLT